MWSVIFVFLSYLDREFVKGEPLSYSLEADKENELLFYMLNTTFCAKSSWLGDLRLHQISDGFEELRVLHDSAGNLLDCSVTTNHMQVKSFMHLCRLELTEQKVDSIETGVRLTDAAEVKEKCEMLKSKDKKKVEENQTLRRSKRGFTYPGTMWCGAGNIADDYNQLGEFTETDKCCRTHDHCPHVIHAFSSKYGYTNFKWHSLSHCDCDNTLKQCLREVNDTSSRVVGQAFFNVIEVPCFELSFEEQCVERHWYGVCKRYDSVPTAKIRESIPYDFGGIEVIDVLTLATPNEKLSEVDKDEREKTQGTESTTQSSFSGSTNSAPEEPSLTNVVTAAEDFIKVLATVSTSQSSSTDGSKGETQTADKKRKKNAGKKKKDSKKRRGKGKKRKSKINRVSKVEEGVTGAPPGNRTEEVISKNIFVEEHGHFNHVSKKQDNFMNGDFDSLNDGEHSNKMMRDEHQKMLDEGQQSTTPVAKHKAEVTEPQKHEEITRTSQPSATNRTPMTLHSKPRRARLRQRMERKRQRHLTPISLSEEAIVHNMREENSPVSTTESTSLASLTVRSAISLAGEEVPRSLVHQGEKGSTFTTATQNTPIVGTKRQKSSQKGGRKKSRNSIPSSSIDKEVSHALTAAEMLKEETTRELPTHPPHEPQSLSKRLQPHHLETFTETPAIVRVGVSGEILPKKRQQRLNNLGKRRQSRLSSSSIDWHTIKASHETTMTAITRTTTIPFLTVVRANSLFQTIDAGQIFFPTQTSTPFTLPVKTKLTKRRRSKERDGKRRRTIKVTET